MISVRNLLQFLPALLLGLLLAGAPAAADPLTPTDASYSAPDGSIHAPKPVDHASRKLRCTASLEEFFEIDDDAEQDFKLQPVLTHNAAGLALSVQISARSYRSALPTHRACASYATGPPHA